jgi:hypothetical protein
MQDDLRTNAPELPAASTSTTSQATSASTLGRIAVRVTVWTSIGTYLNQFIAFVATLVMTRLLDPSVFGMFSLATFWYTLLNLRPKSGISYSAIRQPESNGTLLGTYWGVDALMAVGSLILSIVTGLILLWLNVTLPSLNYTPLMVISVVVLMLVDGISVMVSPLSLILEKEMQLSRLTLVTLAATVTAYGAAIILALNGAGIRFAGRQHHHDPDFDCRRMGRVPTALAPGLSLALAFRSAARPPPGTRRIANWPVTHGAGIDRDAVRQLSHRHICGGNDPRLLRSAYRIAHWPNILRLIVSRGISDSPGTRRSGSLDTRCALSMGTTDLNTDCVVRFFGAGIVKILYTDRHSEMRITRGSDAHSPPGRSCPLLVGHFTGDHRRTVTRTAVQAASLCCSIVPDLAQRNTTGRGHNHGVSFQFELSVHFSASALVTTECFWRTCWRSDGSDLGATGSATISRMEYATSDRARDVDRFPGRWNIYAGAVHPAPG